MYLNGSFFCHTIGNMCDLFVIYPFTSIQYQALVRPFWIRLSRSPWSWWPSLFTHTSLSHTVMRPQIGERGGLWRKCLCLWSHVWKQPERSNRAEMFVGQRESSHKAQISTGYRHRFLRGMGAARILCPRGMFLQNSLVGREAETGTIL